LNKCHNILICPLEWGLGHAARMIPVARKLADAGHKVFIGSGEEHLAFFRKELPGISCVHFPGFRQRYSRFLPQYISILFKVPLLLYHIIREHHGLNAVIRDYSIDTVISDNRFGLWNRKVRTAYFTHMPLIPFPKPFRFLEFTGIMLHGFIIRKYDLCFIPDLPGELNVSGRLSHGLKLPPTVRYTGILSRFSPPDSSSAGQSASSPYNLVILSGPEPQRNIFKRKILDILRNTGSAATFLEGRPEDSGTIVRSENITFISHLPSSEMQEVISRSRAIITRSGYSSIMELISLNRSALLIPTPGQTEQEYLAGYLSARGWFSFCVQGKMTKENILDPGEPDRPAGIAEQSSVLLDNALEELLEEPHYQHQSGKSCQESKPDLHRAMSI
jgi:Glycosyltransferase family 28 C-terminal domain